MGTITSNNAIKNGHIQPKDTNVSISASNQSSYTTETITTHYRSRSGDATKTTQEAIPRSGSALFRNPSADEESLKNNQSGNGQEVNIEQGDGIQITESFSDGEKKQIITNTGVLEISAPSDTQRPTTANGKIIFEEGQNVSISLQPQKTPPNKDTPPISKLLIDSRDIIEGEGIKTTKSEHGLPLSITISNDGVLGLIVTDNNGNTHTCKGNITLQGTTENIRFSYEQPHGSNNTNIILNVTWL